MITTARLQIMQQALRFFYCTNDLILLRAKIWKSTELLSVNQGRIII